MATASYGSGGGSSPAVTRVTMPADFRAFLDALPEKRSNPNTRVWADWEDAFLLEARKRGATWDEIIGKLKIGEKLARGRWRELTHG
jgi:hypothetical protein